MKDVYRGQVKHFAFCTNHARSRRVSALNRGTRYILCYQRFFVAMIADGTYDVIVVDAREEGDQLTHLEFAITSGERRGEIVSITARLLARSAVDLLGTPATLFVREGAPLVEWT